MGALILALSLGCTRPPSFGQGFETGVVAAEPPVGQPAQTGAESGSRPNQETGSELDYPDTGDSASDPGLTQDTLRWVSEPLTCAKPGATSAPRYRVQELPRPTASDWDHWGGGLVVADFTGDDRPEVLIIDQLEVRVHQVVGSELVLVPAGDLFAAPPVLELGAAGSAADPDGDGDLDLIVLQYGAPDAFYRNVDGVLVQEDIGLTEERRNSTSAAWGDLDQDGDLDLIVGTYGTYPLPLAPASPHRAELHLNRGDGTFEDASHLLPEAIHGGLNFLVAFLDVDSDLSPELLVLNDLPAVHRSVMLDFHGGKFSIDAASGFHPGFNSMGLGIADLNGDGFPDLFESSLATTSLLLSVPQPGNPNGVVYVDATALYGLHLDRARMGGGFGWGVEFGDLDNDGDEDAMMVLGHHDGFNETPPVFPVRDSQDHLWLRLTAGNFFEVGGEPEWSYADPGVGRGLVVTDLDRDGYLDQVKVRLAESDRVYWSQCREQRSLVVAPRAASGLNRFGIGTRVEVRSTTGAVRRRWLGAGSTSLFSGAPPEVHFGLGSEVLVAEVRLFWPDGRVDVLTDVPTGQRLTVTRP